MARLKQSDIAGFSRALAALYTEHSASTLSTRILTSLRTLFDCDFASFSLLDLRRGHWHSSMISPVIREWPGPQKYQRLLPDDRAAVYIKRYRTQRALKISDFYSLREYHSSRLYAEMFRPVGCDRRLGFAVQGAPPVTMAATLNRKRRDFSEEERAMLDLLRPHLLQANAQAHADQLTVAAHPIPYGGWRATFGVGLVELDLGRGVRWLTPRAEVLLNTYFPHASRQIAAGRLPVPLERETKRELSGVGAKATEAVLRAPTGAWYFPGPNGRQLKVRLAGRGSTEGYQLLLEENSGYIATLPLARSLGLSPRQGEVLHWVAEGKTNRTISLLLDITENTVGKHLEHILSRLQVPNRTAAVHAINQARAIL